MLGFHAIAVSAHHALSCLRLAMHPRQACTEVLVVVDSIGKLSWMHWQRSLQLQQALVVPP